MSWIKLDDQWMNHPKIIRAGRDARDMWLASLTWCAQYLTDGKFPEEMIPTFAVMAGIDVANCQTFARRLVDICLWDCHDGAYEVHDYLKYNPTKDQTLATREARKEAGRAGGLAKASKLLPNSLAKGVAKSWQKSAPSPYPLTPSSHENDDVKLRVNAADAGANTAPLADCLKELTTTKNKNAVVAKLFVARYGDTYPPNYGRLGKLAKQLSGEHVALAELIWASSKPQGDPHDYLTRVVQNAPASISYGDNGTGPAMRTYFDADGNVVREEKST